MRLMHSRWSLHTNDGRGDRDGAQDRDSIPRWTPTCQSCHRRGGDARGPGRGHASCQVGLLIQCQDHKGLASMIHSCRGIFWLSESVAAWTTLPQKRRMLMIVPETSSPHSTSNCLKRGRSQQGEEQRRSPCTVQRSFWDSLRGATTTVWMSKWYRNKRKNTVTYREMFCVCGKYCLI